MLPIIAFLTIATPVVQGVTTEQGDVMVTSFDVPQGKVTVYLPDDMMAGDTISGTVVTVPNGSGRTAEQNDGFLTGLVIELEGQKPTRGGGAPSWVLPAGISAVAIALSTADGKKQGESSCWVRVAEYSDSPSEFSGDPIANARTPMQIRGPFDGDSANTSATCGGANLVPLAESPRSCVFAGLPDQTGPAQIDVKEGGINSRVHSNLVRVSLSASRTTLLAGERGTLTMSVTGLDGLPEEAFPVPCTIVNKSPGVVRLEGESAWDNVTNKKWDGRNSEEIAFNFNKVDVQPGVPTAMTFNITGVQPGAFLIAGLCFNVKMHDVKKAMDAATFRAWIQALVTSYEEKIKRLEAEEKEDPARGRRLNIARKKAILDVLKSYRRQGKLELDTAKLAVDKALADDAFFAMAAELITTAAEMLGYTDIPMPGIGTIVKGIKAIAGAAKLAKVLKALEEAEKLIEAYEKLTDAQKKIEQVQKIKDALDKVKEELDNAE